MFPRTSSVTVKLCSTLSSTVSTSNKRSEIIWASSDSTLKQIFEADFCRFESTFAAANQFSKDARNSFLFFTKSFFPPQKIGNDLILTMTSIFGLFSLAGKRCFLNWKKNHLLSFISSFYSQSVLFSFECIRILGSLSTETFWIHLHPPLTKFLICVWHFLSVFFKLLLQLDCNSVVNRATDVFGSQRSAFQKKIPTRHFFSRQCFFLAAVSSSSCNSVKTFLDQLEPDLLFCHVPDCSRFSKWRNYAWDELKCPICYK